MTGNPAYLTGSRQEPGQLRAADAADLPRARGLRLSDTARRGARRAALHLGRDLCALPPPGLGAGAARHRPQRHRGGDGAEHRRRCYEAHFGVPMAGAVLNTLNTRLDAETIAFMLRHGGARVLITDREFSADGRAGAGAARRAARWSSTSTTRRCPTAALLGDSHLRGIPGRGRSGLRLADPAGRVGRDLAELHLGHHRRSEGRGLPPSRRAPERGQQRPQLGHAARIRSISGRCRCSTATAGASRGRSPSAPAPMCACAGSRRRRCSMRSARNGSTHMCGAPIVYATLINAPDGAARRASTSACAARSPAPRRPPRSSRAPSGSASN